MKNGINAKINPSQSLAILSQNEINRLSVATQGGLHALLRRCALAVLNSGHESDDVEQLLTTHQSFNITVASQDRGVQLHLTNAPHSAFVDGQIIQGIRENLFSVLRDIVYTNTEVYNAKNFDPADSKNITHAVFKTLRNADLLVAEKDPNVVVCWGGHSINRNEYNYTKKVGYELGLRSLDICTGCGPGAMKGPMKGATISCAKQRNYNGRYIGITEPGIIAAEAPNPIVNELVIMPDIEKRLEAFVRLGHGIIIFPGGVGTTEEILYLLGILLHPDNIDIPFPVVLTGPKESKIYFEEIIQFITTIIGKQAKQRLSVIIDNPTLVAQTMKKKLAMVKKFRIENKDAFHFNWLLNINELFQQPFIPSHENMSELELDCSLDKYLLAANLRKAFSGIVAGNVKEDSIKAIKQHGHFLIKGDSTIKNHLDRLLSFFVRQQRMKLPGTNYVPCYKIA